MVDKTDKEAHNACIKFNPFVNIELWLNPCVTSVNTAVTIT